MVWLDNGGVRSVDNNSLNKTLSISQLIIKNLDEKGLENFKKNIAQNITKDIKMEIILGTHIGLCKHLKIYEAKETLYKILNEGFFAFILIIKTSLNLW